MPENKDDMTFSTELISVCAGVYTSQTSKVTSLSSLTYMLRIWQELALRIAVPT